MRPFNTVIIINIIIIGQQLTSLITSSNTNFSLIFTMLSLDPCRYLTPAQLLCYDDNEGDLGRRRGRGHLASTWPPPCHHRAQCLRVECGSWTQDCIVTMTRHVWSHVATVS